MSIWTRDKVYFSADKASYWEYRPGTRDARLVVNDGVVITASSTGVTFGEPVALDGGVGAVTATGRVTVGAGLSYSYSTGLATASTIGHDTVVSLLTATAAAPTYVLAAPSSAGIVKIIINTEIDSTHHIDFPAGDLVNTNSTENYINMGPAHACVGLISLSTDVWAIMFPSFSTATVAVSTVSS